MRLYIPRITRILDVIARCMLECSLCTCLDLGTVTLQEKDITFHDIREQEMGSEEARTCE